MYSLTRVLNIIINRTKRAITCVWHVFDFPYKSVFCLRDSETGPMSGGVYANDVISSSQLSRYGGYRGPTRDITHTPLCPSVTGELQAMNLIKKTDIPGNTTVQLKLRHKGSF